MEVKIGVVGYSDESVYNHDIAKALVAVALDAVADDTKADEYVLVSGLTDQGIPGIAYRMAEDRGWKTVGLSAKEAKQYDCFDVDEEIIVGEKFGDESEEFIGYIDYLVRIGGGEQSMKETEMAKKKGVKVYEYDLPKKEKK